MNRITTCLSILLFVFSSCTVFKEYPIEVYKPGEIVVPSDAKSVALVYRNFKYDGDSLQHYFKADNRLRKSKNDPENLDSLLADYAMKELASNLKSKNTFERIHIFPGIFKPHYGKKLPALNFSMVRKITETSETDLLISLETFSYFFSTYSADYDVPKSNEVVTAAVWAVYDPVNEKLLERKTMIDTIFWNNYDEQGNYVKSVKLPPRKTALQIASQLAGENYSKRFFASWKKVNRIYSVPPLPDFEQASLFIEKREYDKAIALWKKYALEKNGKMAINARYNIAFAYELKDDLDMAIKWLEAAREIAGKYKSREDLKMIIQYQRVLAQRKKEINLLNQ